MNLDRIKLIIHREYVTRVRGKGFIIATLLIPVFLLAMIFIPILLSNFGSSSTQTVFPVSDATGSVAERMVSAKPERYYIPENVNAEQLRVDLLDGKIEGYVLIPEAVINGSGNPEFFNRGNVGLALESEIRNDIRAAVREEMLHRSNVSDEVRGIFEWRPSLETRKVTTDGEQNVDSESSFFLAYIMGMAIYFAMFGYGALIMNGVMEEKTNRIVEVIVSAAKPMELLIGKVVGIVALGLTQIAIWGVALMLISMVLAPALISMTGSGAAAGDAAGFELPSISISVWIFFAVFYVLGFMIYGGLFAAVGSAADSPQDVQQLSMPLYLPIMIPIFLLAPVSTDPDSTLAVVTSLIPFFSPILMMVRIAVSDVPLWQSLGSVLLMIGTFLALMWASGKIYRTGILMYGKKVTFMEILRWLRH